MAEIASTIGDLKTMSTTASGAMSSFEELIAPLTRHLLLLSATPHNGKEADFQLFMALLDPDRFDCVEA